MFSVRLRSTSKARNFALLLLSFLVTVGCKQDLSPLTPSSTRVAGVTTSEIVTIVTYYPTGAVVTNAAAAAQSFIVSARSPVGKPITYTWLLTNSVGTATQVASDATGTYSFNPALYAADTYTLKVTASDTISEATQSWSVRINQAPTIMPTNPTTATKSISFEDVLALTATVADPDGDALSSTWTIGGAVNGALVDGGIVAGTATGTFTASDTFLGSNNVTLSITDGNLTTTYTWTITVNYFSSACNALTTNKMCIYVGWQGAGSNVDPLDTKATFAEIKDYDFDAAGNVYILDEPPYANGVLLKIWNRGAVPFTFAGTTIAAGKISVVAGNGVQAGPTSGLVTQMLTASATGVAVDRVTGDVYISGGTAGLRKLTQAANTFTTVIPAEGTMYSLRYFNNKLYFTVAGVSRIKSYDLGTTVVTTILSAAGGGYAGDGNAANNVAVNAFSPYGIAIDPWGNLFFSETSYCAIRVICASPITGGVCSTGQVDGSNRLRVNPANGIGAAQAGYIYTFAGTPGTCQVANTTVAANDPISAAIGTRERLDFTTAGHMVMSSFSPSVVRAINTSNGAVSIGGVSVAAYQMARIANEGATSAWGSVGTTAKLSGFGIGLDSVARYDTTTTKIMLAETLNSGAVRWDSRLLYINNSNILEYAAGKNSYFTAPVAGTFKASQVGTGGAYTVVAVSPTEHYIGDNNNGFIRKVDGYGRVTIVNRGSGIPSAVTDISNFMAGEPFIKDDGSGNILILDRYYHSIFLWNRSSASITKFGVTIAPNAVGHIAGVVGAWGYNGNGAPATSYRINYAYDVAVYSNELYIGDTNNSCIRKVDATNTISTVVSAAAGCGTPGNGPNDNIPTNTGITGGAIMAFDSSGNLIYVDGNGPVRMWNRTAAQITAYNVTIDPGKVKIIAGSGVDAFNNGIAATNLATYLSFGMVVEPTTQDIFIGSSYYNIIRRITRTTGLLYTIAGANTATYNWGRYPWGSEGENATPTTVDLFNTRALSLDSNGDLYWSSFGFVRKLKLSP